ncbi:MAG: hypothetical protein JW845_09235 [Dehalococcoidales bacterium]|nr:hypothetical protein [Dehalococcoidales bacterium]
MSDNRKKILEMLEQSKISADEAYRLLSAVDDGEKGSKDSAGEGQSRTETGIKSKSKYLRVTVTPGDKYENPERADRVNVRVPMSLIRAGIKLTSLIPQEALDKANDALKEKGINFDVRSIKSGDIEELIDALGDMQVDVETSKGECVKVFVE